MRYSRSLASVFLAILIANPLCCCALNASGVEPSAGPSCCSHEGADQDKPVQGSCECCQAKSPRLADGGKAPVVLVDLPELAPLSIFALIPPIAKESQGPGIEPDLPDSRPPRLILALQQRFLI